MLVFILNVEVAHKNLQSICASFDQPLTQLKQNSLLYYKPCSDSACETS